MRLIEAGLLVFLALASNILPVFRLPRPTGPFPVGTVTQTLDGEGSLAPQIWYPAAPTARARAAPYEPATSGWRNWVFRHVRTDALQDAPLAAGTDRFPVLIYVNGWDGTRWENSALMQELASHGYVVAASDQPGGVVDSTDLSTPWDTSSQIAWHRTEDVAAVKLRVQVGIARRVLDRLAALGAESGSRFARRLDPARAGILGFSFGGATAAEAATDPRFRAVVNMDGRLFGEAWRSGITVPYLELSDDGPPPADRSNPTLAQIETSGGRQTRANLARNGGMMLTIRGTLHPNFSDYPVLVSLRRFSGGGPVDPRRAARVIDAWVVGFFDHVFKGKELPDPAQTPEAVLDVWPAPAVKSRATIDAPAKSIVLQQ